MEKQDGMQYCISSKLTFLSGILASLGAVLTLPGIAGMF
jgi:preprotein translocase subunit SecD